MRYAVQGVNSTVLDSTSTLLGQNLLGRNISSTRVFYLQKAWLYNASGGVEVNIYDVTAGTGATASKLKAIIPCATDERTEANFGTPGLKFTTGCCAIKGSTANGYFGVGYAGGVGFEEG